MVPSEPLSRFPIDMKRKLGPQRSFATSAEDGQGSRFAACPACGLTVPLFRFDVHLDSECSSAGPSVAPAPTPLDSSSGSRRTVQEQALAPLPQQPQPHAGFSTQRPGKEPVAPLGFDSSAAAAPAASLPVAAAAAAAPGTAGARSAQQEAGPAASSNVQGSSSRAAGWQWWQGHSAIVATGYRSSGQQRVGLTRPALLAAAHCELLPEFLPAELADALLLQLQADSPSYERMEWWIGEYGGASGEGGRGEGNVRARGPGLSSMTTCHYQLAEGGAVQQQQQQQQASNFAGSSASLGGSMGAAPDTSARRLVPAPAPLCLAADMVAACVSERIGCGAAAGRPVEAADRRGWAPSYAMANCYQDGSCGVGTHSDRLTPLGPAPIIASLSLGATRTFRLHRQQRLVLQGGNGAAGSGSSGSAGAGGGVAGSSAAAAVGDVTRVDVELPHNALCIMWPPCQEAWKHEIPTTTKPFPLHPTVGAVRFNLTFRRQKPEWEARAPLCRCGRRAVMKARQPRAATDGPPSSSLHYIYTCDSSKGPPCGFWKNGPSLAL